MAGNKARKAGSCSMIEGITCGSYAGWLENKARKEGSRSMIEGITCGMWVDMESCKGLTSESERNELVFDCWKCKADEEVKMAQYIERLKAEIVSLKINPNKWWHNSQVPIELYSEIHFLDQGHPSSCGWQNRMKELIEE
ncbi:hypothetical protein FHG87_005584 [Trinorchestia longiramus]|nr:hypothetical protein FHG87_005584 [Trinorchestia longiramus]